MERWRGLSCRRAYPVVVIAEGIAGPIVTVVVAAGAPTEALGLLMALLVLLPEPVAAHRHEPKKRLDLELAPSSSLATIELLPSFVHLVPLHRAYDS